MGSTDPHLIEAIARVLAWFGAIPHVWLAIALAVIGLLTTGVVVHAALVCHPACRAAWIAISVTCVLWTAGYGGILLGLPQSWVWGLMHPLSLACVGVGILAFPGVRRPVREWIPILLDGWMSVGGVVVISWMVLHPALLAAGRGPVVPMLVWVGIDFLVATALAGLLVSAPIGARRAVGFVAVGAMVASFADLNLALLGPTELTSLLWALVTLMVGAIPVVGGPNLFLSTFTSTAAARVITLSQLPLMPAVIFLFAPLGHDLIANVGAGTVIAVAFWNVAGNSKQNAELVDRIRAQTSQLEAVLTGSQDVILQLSPAGVIEFANPAATDVLGYQEDELTGRSIIDFVDPRDTERNRAEWHRLARGEAESVRVEFRMRHADGGYRFMETSMGQTDGPGGGLVLSIRDVSAGVALRDRLAHQARTDPLTGLLNRAALLAAIGTTLEKHGRATLLFIDLDEFKAVNDTLGHAAGDDVLIQVAHRLRAVMREGKPGSGADPAAGVARIGGDEFAVMVPPSDSRTPGQLATAVLTSLSRVRTPENLRPGHASIGIVDGPASSPEEVLRDADLAMYQAKRAGGDMAIAFEPWMRERMIERSRLRAELESTLSAGGLSLALQPVVDLPSGTWRGFEALVRWPMKPPRMPDEFLPLAEETGLIVPLGTWVLRTALATLAQWDDAQLRAGGDPRIGAEPPSIAVNVSPRQLDQEGFVQGVLDALAEHDIEPGRLVLEITEQTAVQDLGSAAPRLSFLRDSGVHIAIDDFGTGYSSLRYLTRLPVDQLKIDKQFVAGIGVHAEDEVLVTTMLRLATDLGLEVVAEGVETTVQAEHLHAAGCRLAQGYLYSRPIPMGELLHRSGPGPGPAGNSAGRDVPSLSDKYSPS